MTIRRAGVPGQLVLKARLQAPLADVVAEPDPAVGALDLLGGGRPDASEQRAREAPAGRQLRRALHHLHALDRLHAVGERRVVRGAQRHGLHELLGPGPVGGARQRGAVDVQDAGQRGRRRVDVAHRGAIDADPHDGARRDERPAPAVEDRRARRRVANGAQALGRGQARMDHRRAPDHLPMPVAALQRDARVVGPRPDGGHVPAHEHRRPRAVALLGDGGDARVHARAVEAAPAGRQRGAGGPRIGRERRRTAIVAVRPGRHEGIERLAGPGRLGAANEEDDDRRDGDQGQRAEGHQARAGSARPGHEGREARHRRRVQRSP